MRINGIGGLWLCVVSSLGRDHFIPIRWQKRLHWWYKCLIKPRRIYIISFFITRFVSNSTLLYKFISTTFTVIGWLWTTRPGKDQSRWQITIFALPGPTIGQNWQISRGRFAPNLQALICFRNTPTQAASKGLWRQAASWFLVWETNWLLVTGAVCLAENQ